MQFKLDHLNEVYYKPVVQTTIGAKYSLFDRKLNLGFKGILCQKEPPILSDITVNTAVPSQLTSTGKTKESFTFLLRCKPECRL